MAHDDEYNIALYLSGNEAGLHALIHAYTKPVYSFIRQMVRTSTEAEDVTQETFIKMWKHIKKYKQGQGFKTWLFTIAHNTAIDHLRKRKSYVFSDFEKEDGKNTVTENIKDTEPMPDELFDQIKNAEQMKQLLEDISPMYKEVLILHYRDELTFDEIGTVLGKPLNTVKSHHRRALIELRKRLQKD